MALKAKKKAKSTKSEKPKVKKAAPKAEKTAKVKVKAKATNEKAGKVKKAKGAKKVKKYKPTTNMVASEEISPKARKLIKEIDGILAAEEKKNELFSQLVEELGSNSFDHPELGPTCVMSRSSDKGDTWWWRTKPEGKRPSKKAA